MSDIFHLIASGQKAQVIYALRENPSLGSLANPEGITPLLFALYYGKEDIIQAYLTLEIPLNLFEAAALGNQARVQELLEKDPTAVHSYSPDGWTPLHLAAHFGRSSLVTFLLDHGAELQAKSKSKFSFGNTPLHSAVASGKDETVKLLIERGADPNYGQEEGGYTPLHIAASRQGNGHIVALLLKHGANPELKTKDGQTAREIAMQRGNWKEAEILE
ncbi:ankyrin repeat protein [Leptospira fainei serovar Hurstbridge str. BUT 6]|uniref:Ankyrin repeat protein n=1 Tax=Leptospira fainei serovar Hurstbridge str. BUT 6 TaxID=1193011 RepID=S3VB02_9LEPT|nr:ankyrin repeat domain-containing protein [Leptospira fainei]EPG73635.1 ankyrin repeat protein [Leptospira fainei serovar Hurstbridge str. BUT 6]